MFMIKVGYPDRDEEIEIMRRTTSTAHALLQPILDGEQIQKLQEVVRQVVVADHVFEYVADIVRATRPGETNAPKFVRELVGWGAGPRACQYLILGGKARAILNGRLHVMTEDIRAVAYPVLRHRLVTTFHADAEGITTDDIIRKLLDSTPLPLEEGAAKVRRA
jgi:MoxR-like ATPase